MNLIEFELDLKEIGLDFKKRADFKYIIGKKNTDENIPGLVGFKNAIFLVLKNEKIKLEYFKGQIFKEVFFETQNDCIEFIKVNFK